MLTPQKNKDCTPFKVIHDEAGQLCNRFWSYLDTIGWAVRNNRKVYIIFWDYNIKDFDKLRHNPFVSFPFYRKKWLYKYGDEKILSMIRRFWPRNKVFAKLFYVNPYLHIFVYGWPERNSNRFYLEVKEKVRKLFIPNVDIVNGVESLMWKYKKRDCLLVGVHIRRGDYRRFFRGRFFFSFDQYVEWMTQLSEMYKGKVCFYISSNERVPLEKFTQFHIINNTDIVPSAAFDLYALSCCDRIIGPISTFSRWASFYGHVPLCFLWKGLKLRKESQFSPVVDYEHFEDGRQIFSLNAFWWRCKRLGVNI